MACESGSGIVPRAGGNRGDVYGRRRHSGMRLRPVQLRAKLPCARSDCLIGTRRSSPGPVPPALARQCEKELLAGCPCLCSTAWISRARLVLAARQVPWPRRYHDVHGNLHMHVYFYIYYYMISYLLHAPRSYPFLDCAFILVTNTIQLASSTCTDTIHRQALTWHCHRHALLSAHET